MRKRWRFLLQFIWKRPRLSKKVTALFFIVLLLLIFFFWLLGAFVRKNESLGKMTLGVTFNISQARYFGLDWKSAFIALMDDLQIRHFRIPVEWDEVEAFQDEFSFEEIDTLLREAKKRDAQVILAIGMRVPRWPECHIPLWAKDLSVDERKAEIRELLSQTVERYRAFNNITLWQVENEPLFNLFGKCPEGDRDFLKEEVAIVKQLDARPVMITDSGELSTWLATSTLSDVLGISMYRVTWNDLYGNFYYPITPQYYRLKAKYIKLFIPRIIVTELQAEPWGAKPVWEMSLEEQYASMNPHILQSNLAFARRTGFSEVYLWGAEWWYWLKVHGEDALWNAVREEVAKE